MKISSYFHSQILPKNNETLYVIISSERVKNTMKKVSFLIFIGLLVGCANAENDNASNTNYLSSSTETVLDSVTNDDKQEVVIGPSRTVKVYLNPSVQTWNSYVNNLGTEAEHMNNIANYMIQELKDYDFIELKANTNYLSLNESVKESNTFKADIHFALHSNAGGGQGLEILTINSKKFSQTMYDGFFELGDFKPRGIKSGANIYEIKNSKAQDVALIELLFHDNINEANFIVNNEKRIAKNLTKSLINYVTENY